MERRQVIGFLGLAGVVGLTAAPYTYRFPGIYKLVSWKNTNPDGTVVEPLGASLFGRITYHKSGHMSVQLMRRNRKPLPRLDIQTVSIDELRTGLRTVQDGTAGGFIAYMGTYEVQADRHIVIHHLKGGSSPAFSGQDFERCYELTDQRLNLSAPPNFDSNKLVWERVADA